MYCSEWHQRHEVLLVHLQQTSILFIRNTMHYPLLPCLVQAQWDHKTPWPKNTEEGMQKVSSQIFLLLNVCWNYTHQLKSGMMHAHIHPKVTHNPIKTFETYSKNSLCKYCAQFQGKYPTTTALKALQKNIQTFWTGLKHIDWVSGKQQL